MPLTPTRIKRMLQTGLPVGTPRSQVRGWIDAQTFKHLLYVDKDGRIIGVHIDDVWVDWWVLGRAEVYFEFDADDRLTRFRLETWEYPWGP
jgi:hypothetical protein